MTAAANRTLAVVDDPHLSADSALLTLGQWLRAQGYRFITVTPETHQRYLARNIDQPAQNLRDVFGWNRPFAAELLPADEYRTLKDCGVLQAHGADDRWISTVRWSNLGELLLLHSGFPTTAQNAVFFGPDTYRYAQALHQHLHGTSQSIHRAIDIGCGSGAGALVIAQARPQAQVIATDINPTALRFTEINAALAEIENISTCISDLLQDVTGEFDLIVANPPYLQDADQRAYRHGGGQLGSDLSLKIVTQALGRLSPGGSLLLYTGTPIVDGIDLFFEHARALFEPSGYEWEYQEMDPDVFGEELSGPAYRETERIAVVVLKLTRPR